MVEIKNDVFRLNGKPIGFVSGNTLIMKRTMQKHHYHILNSWNLNVETVNSGLTQFIIDTDTERYIIKLPTIQNLRKKLNLFVTFQKERQLAVPLECWDKYKKPDLTFPTYIGMPAESFVQNCTGRWRSRLIAYSQTEIVF